MVTIQTTPSFGFLRYSALLSSLFLVACLGQEGDTIDLAAQYSALGEEGPWQIPPTVLTRAAEHRVTVTEGGAWVGPSGCAGGMTDGARSFRSYLLEHYPQISRIGGYNCREIVGIPGEMSLHGTGRALDIHIPMDGATADNDLGDPIANWLLENAEHIGVQRVIWDRWMWSAYPAGYVRSQAYDWPGTGPHYDHIHMELSVEASEERTDFFSGTMAPPTPVGCEAIGSSATVIDNQGSCFEAFGNSRYWRVVEGAGIGGSYIWTNAFRSDEPSNWARWILNLDAAGEYEVEFHTVAEHAVFAQTRYSLRHGGRESVVEVDQSASAGWRSLGVFAFDAGGDQFVSVLDNHDASVASNQHICVDALRVTRLDVPDPAAPSPDPGSDDAGSAAPMPADAGVPGVQRDAAVLLPTSPSGEVEPGSGDGEHLEPGEGGGVMATGCAVGARAGGGSSSTPLRLGLLAFVATLALFRRRVTG